MFFSAFVGQEARLRQEVFFLSYNLHWSYEAVLDMYTEERWAFVRLLSEQLEKERNSIKTKRS